MHTPEDIELEERFQAIISDIQERQNITGKPMVVANRGITVKIGELVPGGLSIAIDGKTKTFPCRCLGPATQQEYLDQLLDPEYRQKALESIQASNITSFSYVEVVD